MLHEVPVHMCDGCMSLLVKMRDNLKLMRGLCDELGSEVDADVWEIPKDDGARVCPACSGAMERFEYQFDSGVFLDRCGPCKHVFMDIEETTALAVTFGASSDKMSGRARESHHQLQLHGQVHHDAELGRPLSRVRGFAR